MNTHSKNLLDLANAARLRGDDVEADILFTLYIRSIGRVSTLSDSNNN